MQVQKIQNNNYNTNFGATLKIHNLYEKMEKPTVEFLEKQFPERTKNISGKLDLYLNGTKKELQYPDTLAYSNNEYKDSIKIANMFTYTKETLLDGFVNSLKGFGIRENAQKEIEKLKGEIVNISHNAFCDSAGEFGKVFRVREYSRIGNDIVHKGSASEISIIPNKY